ncbi:MFS transporter [Streptacidiphilus fuscans]|uniref:MFS transporter n=1 Tax=Streptacidiphilus fuscans TaxID=2789292 RepID=A0A931B0S6_9ACTN|nr:MFS transporter [Streptacidiphilus fuscans]MBF9069055.1 MFS transporter [Streptacidiphilus fuscans]
MIDASTAPAAVAEGPKAPMRLGRIGPLLLIGQLAWAVPGTAGGTLLQSLADDIDPANKIRVITVIAASGAVTSAVGTVVGGRLSDRTRSRIGRRSPWLLASSLVAAVALAACGLTTSLVAIGVLYAAFQLAIGAWVAALSALVPDHVAAEQVGRASSFAGLGYLLGQTVGGVLAGVFVTHPSPGLTLVPWLLVLGAVLIAVLVPAQDNRGVPRAARRAEPRGLVPPVSRDFWLAFTGRFLFILAIVMITQFMLYLFTDYLAMSKKDAGGVLAVATGLVGVLAAVTTVAAGVLSDRLGRKRIFVGGAPLLLAAGLVPLLVAPSLSTVFLFFTTVGLTLGTYLAVDQALMVAVLPDPENAARDLGVLSIGSTLPGVVAPVLGGILVDAAGYTTVFLTSLVLAVAAAAVITRIRSVR